jgi:hypothetical protein
MHKQLEESAMFGRKQVNQFVYNHELSQVCGSQSQVRGLLPAVPEGCSCYVGSNSLVVLPAEILVFERELLFLTNCFYDPGLENALE